MLKEKNVWEKTEQLLQKYKNEWSGPDIPIFIFPTRQNLFHNRGKNGYSFIDKIFLFVPSTITEKELEALFVHEYHHICRLNSVDKPIVEHTLLDSLIMEGLAEHAVLDYCGEQYVLKWNHLYHPNVLERIWLNEYKPFMQVKYGNRRHTQLLFGNGLSRPLLGYTIGFYLIDRFRENNEGFSIPSTISTPSEQFIKD
ncbi:DUF2268 domain-containing protein [Pallidibacillus pasinlerensis]|uniref:DUF2268 domain-containing protein n=1 Tax=Pallidibacillus pasinlerensis TaxID=2703818 RepID=UPI0028A6EC89|nr:DUF2268 domain-containing putative Zn-dependent protease [Pallidibacillus pasinlerensis]